MSYNSNDNNNNATNSLQALLPELSSLYTQHKQIIKDLVDVSEKILLESNNPTNAMKLLEQLEMLQTQEWAIITEEQKIRDQIITIKAEQLFNK